MPDDPGVTVVTMLVCFLILHARLRAHLASGIPCALFSGPNEQAKPRASAARSDSRARCLKLNLSFQELRLCSRLISARRHPGADLGAQFVYQSQALVGFDVPKGPAVAGARALSHRADAMDGADLVPQHDSAVGANQRAVALP